MISSAIRLVSKAICLVLVVSFGMFVVDELNAASSKQLAATNAPAAAPVARDTHGRAVNPDRSQLRAKIDSVNDSLTVYAEPLVTGQDPWIMRTVLFLLGMLLFGLGGHVLANWLALSHGRRIVPAPIDAELRPRYTPGYR